MAASHSLFSDYFISALDALCQKRGYSLKSLQFTADEYDHLRTFIDDSIVTPEAYAATPLHPEIGRSLNRRRGLLLLAAGDDEAYLAFTKDQGEDRLSRGEFQQLSDEVRALSSDAFTVLLASSLFAPTDKAQAIVANITGKPAERGERFLTQFTAFIKTDDRHRLFPLTQSFTPEQVNLFSPLYYDRLHCRYFWLTEGGNNMTATFKDAIQLGQMTRDDFQLWRWRWLINTFGFHVEEGLKYYNHTTHRLINTITNELEKMFDNVNHCFLEPYLLERAHLAGIEGLPEAEEKFLGHLCAYVHHIHVVAPLGQYVLAGYRAFQQKSRDEGEIAENYLAHCRNKNDVTPDYVPAILNTAFMFFKKTLSVEESLQHAVQFSCHVFAALYRARFDAPISCMQLAKMDNLTPVIEQWQRDSCALSFVIDGKGQMAEEGSKLRLGVR